MQEVILDEREIVQSKKNMKKAFSIVELMVVVIILGLLASVVVPNLIGKSDDAKKQLVKVQMGQLRESLKLFRLDMGRYPTTQEGMALLVKKPTDSDEYENYSSSGYLGGDKIPKDPWNYPYIYISTGNTIDLISLGADGKEGGTDINKDIKLSEF
jgi:general secretion pathway protein G